MSRQSASLLIILASCCRKLLPCRGFSRPAAQWGFPADDFPFPAGSGTFPAGDNRLPAKQESKNQLQDGSNSNRTGKFSAGWVNLRQGLIKKGRVSCQEWSEEISDHSWVSCRPFKIFHFIN
ncbi:MAG TPA: hypothetical protein P5210_13900, partial [Draconibacterium sp.]|nr:hypothetical protein [Draconibacterium sp.]